MQTCTPLTCLFPLKPQSMKCTPLPHDTTRAKKQSLWVLLESLHTSTLPESRREKKKRSRGKSNAIQVSRKYFDLCRNNKRKEMSCSYIKLGRGAKERLHINSYTCCSGLGRTRGSRPSHFPLLSCISYTNTQP